MVTYPYEWKELSFKKTINSVPFNIYLKQPRISGEFIVVQQGDSPIAGYANGSPYRDYKKVVLFGDHTLSLYKPSTPFFVATDGIRILSCKENIDRDYLYYFLQKYKPESEGYKRHFSILLRMDVFLPELSEQQAIASVLSDFDEHIDNLSELIEKKKAIREGALEELVSGRTRIERFDDEWKKTTLDDCAYIFQGGTPRTTNADYWNGDIVWVTPSEITKLKGMYISNSERKITKAGLQNSSAQILPVGTILLCTRATIGELAIATKLMTTNQGFKNLVCKDGVNNIFIAYLLMTLKEVMISKAIGTTFLEISKKALKAIEIVIPEYREQEAIASILTVMDEEIEALEEEKEKMIQIKEGAMDDLLTGRVRLKV